MTVSILICRRSGQAFTRWRIFVNTSIFLLLMRREENSAMLYVIAPNRAARYHPVDGVSRMAISSLYSLASSVAVEKLFMTAPSLH